MPSGMKGILCIKFDFCKIKNTDFWATMFEHIMLTSRKGREELLLSSCVNFMLGCLELREERKGHGHAIKIKETSNLRV